MKELWSPWRMEYILREKPKGCIFCTACAEQRDQENLILHRGKHNFVMMNRYPYNNGHLMVVPYRHVSMLTDLTIEEQVNMMSLVNSSVEVLQEVMRPDGFNIGMNLGAPAGAGIKDHIHMHIVPRWVGDTNFMPVFADTRVIVEALEQSYSKLKPVFDCKCVVSVTQEKPD